MAYKSISFYMTKSHPDFDLALEQVKQGTALRNKLQFLLRQRHFLNSGGRWDSEAVLADYGFTSDELSNLDIRSYALGSLASQLATSEEFKLLPKQCAQQIGIRQSETWKSFWALVKSKKVKKTGIPGYTKRFAPLPIHRNSLNQKKLKYIESVGMSSWSIRFPLPERYRHVKYAQLTAVNSHKLKFTVTSIDEDEPTDYSGEFVAGVDFGLNNLFTFGITSSDTSFVISGKPLKRINNAYNYKMKELRSRYDVEKSNAKKKGHYLNFSQTNLVQSLTENRNRRIKAYANAATSEAIRELQKADIGLLVIGYNEGIKTNANMGKNNNHKFVPIPHKAILDMLARKCIKAGIDVVWTEESYTSKSSFLDNDPLPSIHNHTGVSPKFSGKRVSRSMYRSGSGKFIPADLNGAFNIIRKLEPTFSPEDVGCGVGVPRLRLLSVNA